MNERKPVPRTRSTATARSMSQTLNGTDCFGTTGDGVTGFCPSFVTVEGGTLTIRAEDRSDERREEGGWVVREIARGSVMRTVTLPTGLETDRAEATFEHGVLRLRFPKAEQVKPRQIRIQPTTAGVAMAVEAGNGAATAEPTGSGA